MNDDRSSSSEAKVRASVLSSLALAPTVLTALSDENPKAGGSFSLDGRADPLELIVHALNESGADAVGDVVVHESQDDR
jgi:hypothetical protein